MKNNLRIILVLAGTLIFGAACWESPSASNQAAANVENVNQTVTNVNITKGFIRPSSPGAADAVYDLQFLDTMTAQCQSAIDIAKPIAAKSDNAALKSFAAKIIRDQNKQIAQMKTWRGKWFADNPPAVNMEMPGITDSMKGINMRKLEAGDGKQLDLRFLGIMTQHHEGSLIMLKEAPDKAEHAEIKTLANQIIKNQEDEIKQMQAWKEAWSK